MSKTLLITGGCGFIGSHFVRRFLSTHPDWNVINFDKLTYCGNPLNVLDCTKNPRYSFVQGDICNDSQVDAVMAKVHAVVHFAAETHVDRSIHSADDFLMTNIFGTRILLEAALKHKVQRFLHISTDEVYGSIAEGHADENYPLMPNSPYSAAKASSDLLVRAYGKTYDLPVLITRSSNNFGPNQYPEKVIPLFITNLIEGKKVPLYGKGLNRRDWIYVEDNCAGVELVFDKGKLGEIYNIGGGHELPNIELTKAVLRELGAGEEMINPVADRPGHDFRYGLSIEKIKTLGFTPSLSFEEGLKRTVRWYQENPQWWKPLKKDRFTIK